MGLHAGQKKKGTTYKDASGSQTSKEAPWKVYSRDGVAAITKYRDTPPETTTSICHTKHHRIHQGK
jgi:hypothetical protein